MVYKIKHHWFVAVGLLIPLVIIGVILYLNFLPFGYSREIFLDVGSSSDTSGVLFLEGSSSLGSRQMLNGTSFRAIDGTVSLVFNPTVILRNATIDVSLVGTGVYFVEQPSLSDVDWDYSWQGSSFFDDFVVDAPHSVYSQFLGGKEVSVLGSRPWAVIVNYTASESHSFLDGLLTQDLTSLRFNSNGVSLSYSLPDFYLGSDHSVLIGHTGTTLYMFVDSEFVGKVDTDMIVLSNTSGATSLISMYSDKIKETVPVVDDCLVFDGKSRLVFPNSSDMFEVGPFAVWVEWVPYAGKSWGQIIGKFNWELFQEENRVRFFIGRVFDQGPAFSLSSSFDTNVLNTSNSFLGIYKPISDNNPESFIEGYLNSEYIGRTSFGNNTIWVDYGSSGLTIGRTDHGDGRNNYFEGKICSVKFGYVALEPQYVTSKSGKVADGESARFSILGNGTLEGVTLRVTQ